ncbi:spore germination protein [Desulforamulus reducens MI-1]|uniref:Spore germination protein n=1 Tax=Desulforamulus reducens (strain ATCC BAA-1160 / DSM 100696 / MI-1) TaxID=349161 RepID=A4J0K2_DESRM|nr:endospore germination permease [Desulforamulus reducens]ABO48605.1 spore germination protein [Desulforamulus reducens MI-1]
METWKISHWQAMGYMISIVFATAILFIPGITSKGAGPNAWLSLFIALGFGLLVACLACSLGLRYPNKTVIDYSVDILGFPLGKLVGFIYIYYFFYAAYIVAREFSELMSTVYLPKTPPLVIALVLTLLSCLVLYLGLEVIVRANGIILFFSILTILLVFFTYVWTINWSMLKPDFFKGIGPILYGSVSPAAWFGQTAVILMLMPFIKNQSGAKPASLLAIFILFIMLESVIIVTVGIFGAATSSRLIFPLFYALAKPPEYIQAFLFQPSGFFMVIWVPSMLLKLTTFFFAGVYGLAQWFNLKCYRPLVLPGGAFILLLSIVSWHNIIDLLNSSQYTVPLFITFANLGLTLILFSVSLIRHRNKNVKGRT